MTLLDPIRSVENLICIGYTGDPSSAIRVTRKRCLDCKEKQSDRNVYQCFVFGPSYSEKSSLLRSFSGRPLSDDVDMDHYPSFYNHHGQHLAVNTVNLPGGSKKTLVLRDKLYTEKGDIASCDVAIFVHDSSNNERSWGRVQRHGFWKLLVGGNLLATIFHASLLLLNVNLNLI